MALYPDLNAEYVLDLGENPEEQNPHFSVPPHQVWTGRPKCCLFNPKFCLKVPIKLRFKEKLKMREDCFKIYGMDEEHDKEYFRVSNPMRTVRGKHVLQDLAGNDLCKMKTKIMTLRTTWNLIGGEDCEQRIATMAFNHTLMKKKARIFVYPKPYPHEDSDTNYDELTPLLYLKSDAWGRSFNIHNYETKEVYAEIKKTGKLSDIMLDRDNYYMEVKEGVDVLFMTALVLMYEYASTEQEQASGSG